MNKADYAGTACPECGARTERGTTTLTFERDGIMITIAGVPAEICPSGHEPYISGEVFEAIGAMATQMH